MLTTIIAKRWAPIAIGLLTPLYYLLPWARLGGIALPVGVPFLLFYAVLLPGVILSDRLAPRRTDALERFAAGMLFGLAFVLAAAFLFVLTGASLGLFAKLLPVAVVVVGIVGFLRPDPGEPLTTVAAARGERALLAGFSVFLLLMFVLVLRAGIPIDFIKDSLDHVAYVNETVERQEAFPTTAFYLDPGANGKDIRKGFLHVFYGYGVGYLGVDTLRFLNLINAIFTVVLLLSVYSMTLILLSNRTAAILAAVVFLVAVDGGLGSTLVRQSFYPHRFAIAFFFYVVAHGLRFVETARRRELLLAGIFAFTACATHVLFALLIGFAGLSILVWKFCFPRNNAREHFRRVATLSAAAVAGMLPVCLYRYVTDFPEPNELHADVQGVVFITRNLFIADPIQMWQWLGPIGVASLFTIRPLWRDRVRFPVLGYVFASFFTLAAVLFNPVLLPPLRDLITYLIARLNHMCFFYIAVAFFLVSFLSSREKIRALGWSGRIAVVLLALGFANALWAAASDSTLSARRLAEERTSSYELWSGELSMLRDELPPRSVVASDPMTSYSISAFTPHYTVCTFDQHAPPNDLLLAERIQDGRDILSPDVPMQRTVGLLAKHRATHIVLNDRFPPDLNLEYWVMNPNIFRWTRAKFQAHPDLFETLYEKDDFVVLAWNGSREVGDTSYTRPSVVDTLPAGFTRVGRPAGEAILEGFAIEKGRVAREGSFGMRMVWSGEREQYRLGNWVVAVRFDHTNPALPFAGKPAPKVVRKIKENLIGKRYRFREQHKIRSGFLSPDTWRPGDLVLDETTVEVPPDLVPGEYAVSVKLLRIEHQPTYWLRDLFVDDDAFQGIAVATIVIE